VQDALQLYAPQFEADHKDSLAQDWARIPIPKDQAVLADVVELGDKAGRLLDPIANVRNTIREILGSDARGLAIAARLDESKLSESAMVMSRSYYGAARGDWRERIQDALGGWRESWGSSTGDLFINDEVCFKNVPERVWRYELGGYPVLKKWLSYRHSERRSGGPLTLAEADHFRSMVQRLAALLALGPELDAAYEGASADCLIAEDLAVR